MTEPAQPPIQPGTMSRKRFLQAGAAVAGAVYLGGAATSRGSAAPTTPAVIPDGLKDMNVVIFLTDQEIYHDTVWAKGWLDTSLPGLAQRKKHGVTFTNAFTNTCACSPARSTIQTGQYPAQHGVKYVLEHNL